MKGEAFRLKKNLKTLRLLKNWLLEAFRLKKNLKTLRLLLGSAPEYALVPPDGLPPTPSDGRPAPGGVQAASAGGAGSSI
jgi:hypothetical protein